MLARWQNEKDPRIAERSALVALLEPLDGPELELAVELADTAVASNHPSLHNHFLVAHGLATYRRGLQADSRQDEPRAGQFYKQAQQSLETAIEQFRPDDHRFKRAQARFILAMVLHHLKDNRADDVLTESAIDYQSFPQFGRGMVDVYMVRALRCEAIRTIVGPGFELVEQVEQLLAAGDNESAMEQIRDIALPKSGSGVIPIDFRL
jgi:hypothetical protein